MISSPALCSSQQLVVASSFFSKRFKNTKEKFSLSLSALFPFFFYYFSFLHYLIFNTIMSFTVKSCSSFDTNEYIDLDTALVQEELRSLGATPETRDYNNDNYRISFKNMDARETERLRNSLVTPMSSYSINIRSLTKTPVDSCAESVALFKNLANNGMKFAYSKMKHDQQSTCVIARSHRFSFQ